MMSKSAPSWIPPEILCLIFELLDAKDQAAASVVCRSWSGPASHVLWSTRPIALPTLMNVLVPSSSRLHMYHPYVPNIRDLDHRRLASFLSRSASVSSLHVDQPILQSFHNLVEAITTAHGTLCPNLLHLSVEAKTDTSSTCALFAGASVRGVKVRQENSWTAMAFDEPSNSSTNPAAVQALSQHCPAIESLDVQISGQTTISFKEFGSLRRLAYVGPFSYAFWSDLAAHCPHLETIELGRGMWFHRVSTGVTPCSLPSLRHLDLLGVHDTDMAARLLKESRMPSLRTLAVSLPHQQNKLASTILQPLEAGSPQLEELTVNLPTRLRNCEEQPIIQPDSFKQLKTLTLQARVTSFADADRVVDILPGAMTTLQSLAIKFTSGGYTSPVGVMMGTLAVLSERFGGLETLQASIDGSDLLDVKQCHKENLFPRLKRLLIDPLFLWRNDMDNLAGTLAGMFPKVQTFDATLAVRSTVGDSEVMTFQEGDGNFRETIEFAAEEERLANLFWGHRATLNPLPGQVATKPAKPSFKILREKRRERRVALPSGFYVC